MKGQPKEPLEIKGQVVEKGTGDRVGVVEEEIGGLEECRCCVEIVCEVDCCVWELKILILNFYVLFTVLIFQIHGQR